MKSLTAWTNIEIAGTRDSWKIAQPGDPPPIKDRVVRLEIIGDDKDGYHLCQSPEGCFTADTHHATVADAMETAERLFNVPASAWKKTRPATQS